MGSDFAVKLSGVSKTYRLYENNLDRLKEALIPFGRKRHSDFHAIKEIDLQIRKGEVLGILGKNGCGKSTLLKIVTGVLTPTSGTIETKGQIAALLELGAGFNLEMTGIENIYLNGTLRGLARNEITSSVDEILDFADIGDFVKQPVKLYSSGMFARLAFSLAIHGQPDILIVDEILSVGDAAFQRKCFSRMESLRDQDTTIIYVSHSAASVVELCDRAILMHDGEALIEGPAKKVAGFYSKYSGERTLNKKAIKAEYDSLLHGFSTQAPEEQFEMGSGSLFTASYDPNLVSKSKVEYEANGVQITNLRIETEDGRKVNVLVSGEEYFFYYDVDSFEQIKSVQFGMLLKSIGGVELAGSTHPSTSQFLPTLASGRKTVRWKMKILLSSGEYFLNAGVRGDIGNGIDYLHRVLDALVFRVVGSQPTHTGYITICDFDDIR